ncbi:MAG: diguanylate cyclase [Dehalococcoidia bacterium]|nr:diguanylate cyclase [Dehalococcoidia bacterium]
MHLLAHRTIVFRLWLALSLVAVVCTTFAFGIYAWLSIDDSIDSAHEQTEAKIKVVLLAAARLGIGATGGAPGEGSAAAELGIEAFALYDGAGQTLAPGILRTSILGDQPIDPTLLSAALAGETRSRSIRISDVNHQPAEASPWRVLWGQRFGEEYAVPLSALIPDQPGAAHIVVTYPDLTTGARILVYRSVLAADLIIIALLIGAWLLLRHFVSTPLRSYSGLAMRIAVGEQVRMPAGGANDELGQLARAVNGMADALEYQATVDALTGLYNLRHLSSHLEALIVEAELDRKPLSVIFGDLDSLKPVNDTYGHEAGDSVLRAVGDAIHEWAGNKYTCWRLGGDEFVVALPDTGEDEALIQAAHLGKVVSSLLVPVQGTHARPSISLGISTYPEDGSSAGTLLGIADRRMYATKAMRGEERRAASTSASAAA